MPHNGENSAKVRKKSDKNKNSYHFLYIKYVKAYSKTILQMQFQYSNYRASLNSDILYLIHCNLNHKSNL